MIIPTIVEICAQRYLAKVRNSITVNDSSQNHIDRFSYSYDANKNVTGETRGGVMSGFSWNTDNSGAPGYDDEDRLVYWKHADSSQTQSWNLSLVGDWNSTTINGTQQNRTHNNVHELTAVDSTPLTYDVKRNLKTNTNGHTYSWDFDIRLTGADTDGNPGDDVLYEYDALGRRIRKNNGTTNTVFVLAGWQVIAEYASGASPASPSEQYIYASYIDEPILKTGTGGSVYYSRNRQYSITCLTNSTGAPVEYYAYDSHGKLAIFDASGSTLSAPQYANPYTYTGRRFDSKTALYYFRARYFDSEFGRFIGRDPIGYVDGMSLYRGNFLPTGLDPSGMREVCCGYERGWVIKEKFERTVECEEGRSAEDCCLTNGTFLYGWFSWEVKHVDEGSCDRFGPPTTMSPSIPYRILQECFECVIHPFGIGGLVNTYNAAKDAEKKGWRAAEENYGRSGSWEEHRAMRHCVASGVLATRPFIHCGGAECIGTAREDVQDENGQDVRHGEQAKNNNKLGRRCVGCLGENADQQESRPNASLNDIIACCKNAIDNGQADLRE